MEKKVFCRLLLIFFLSIGSANAFGLIMLYDSSSDRKIKQEDILFFADYQDTIDFENLLARKQKVNFSLLPSMKLEPIYNGTYWLKILIFDKTTAERKWILESTSQNMKVMEVWVPDHKGNYHLHRAGLNNIGKKLYPHKNDVFDLPSGIERYIIYVKASCSHQANLDLTVHSQESFTENTLKEYLLLGLFYGVLAIIFGYSILAYLSTWKSHYIAFSLYLIACMFFTLSFDGLGTQFIWTSYSAGNLHFYYFLAPQLFLVASVLFARSFLNLKVNFPIGDNILLAASGIILTFMVMRSTGNDFTIPDWYLIPYGFILICGIVTLIKGFKPSRLFVLAYLLILLNIAIIHLNLLPEKFEGILQQYNPHAALAASTIIFWLAIADRSKTSDQKKENHSLKKETPEDKGNSKPEPDKNTQHIH